MCVSLGKVFAIRLNSHCIQSLNISVLLPCLKQRHSRSTSWLGFPGVPVCEAEIDILFNSDNFHNFSFYHFIFIRLKESRCNFHLWGQEKGSFTLESTPADMVRSTGHRLAGTARADWIPLITAVGLTLVLDSDTANHGVQTFSFIWRMIIHKF